MKIMCGIKILLAALELVSIAGAQAQSDEELVGEWHFDDGSGKALSFDGVKLSSLDVPKSSLLTGWRYSKKITIDHTKVDSDLSDFPVLVGLEDILLKLSAVNIIGNPVMHVQVIIIPPSGMSVTSSEFVQSGAGQFTTTYELEPGKGKDIEVRIVPNQIGDDFEVQGMIIYYFGDEKEKAEDQTLNLPIKVRKEIASTPVQNPAATPAQKSTPGFELIIGIIGLLFTILLKRKR
jgi:hypothetical protein